MTFIISSTVPPGWLYEHNEDNSARYILGTLGVNPLICFGINPSYAAPHNLDNTVNYVRILAEKNGYDSFTMLNIYPQRATDPNDLHHQAEELLQAANEACIAGYINHRPLTIWAAWGALVTRRSFLPGLVRRIITLPELSACSWVARGALTKGGHPHHPLYVSKGAPFVPFDVTVYLTQAQPMREE